MMIGRHSSWWSDMTDQIPERGVTRVFSGTDLATALLHTRIYQLRPIRRTNKSVQCERKARSETEEQPKSDYKLLIFHGIVCGIL